MLNGARSQYVAAYFPGESRTLGTLGEALGEGNLQRAIVSAILSSSTLLSLEVMEHENGSGRPEALSVVSPFPDERMACTLSSCLYICALNALPEHPLWRRPRAKARQKIKA